MYPWHTYTWPVDGVSRDTSDHVVTSTLCSIVQVHTALLVSHHCKLQHQRYRNTTSVSHYLGLILHIINGCNRWSGNQPFIKMHYFTPGILDIWQIQVTSMTMAIVSTQDSCSRPLIHIYLKYLGSTIRSGTWWEPCWRDYIQRIPRTENIYELQFNYKPHIR